MLITKLPVQTVQFSSVQYSTVQYSTVIVVVVRLTCTVALGKFLLRHVGHCLATSYQTLVYCMFAEEFRPKNFIILREL